MARYKHIDMRSSKTKKNPLLRRSAHRFVANNRTIFRVKRLAISAAPSRAFANDEKRVFLQPQRRRSTARAALGARPGGCGG
jgi:hypothetical protein